ncbi:MAG: hypothetical protein PHP86_16425 [Nevskiales bacterium]|nr:hypothetical protein [Nevskiales bacterium]
MKTHTDVQTPDPGHTLASARALFAQLPPPPALAGTWRAELIGPRWLLAAAAVGMPLSVLRGWCGKRFAADGRGENLVRRGGELRGIIPMREAHQVSRLDGRPVVAATYDRSTPLSLRYVEDEFRQLGPDTLLGMMTFRLPLLRRLGLPFLLHRVADEHAL